jgi:hypothetical protein
MRASKLSLAIANANVLLAFTSAHVLPRQASSSITCNQGSPNTIQASDIQGLISHLNNNNIAGASGSFDLASLATLDQPSSQTITEGSISVALKNSQPFESTHVAFTTVAQALQQYQDVCCGSFPSCIGGSSTVTGDTGLNVSIDISPS